MAHPGLIQFVFLATCLLRVWCRWLSSNTSFCKLPVSVVLRLWPASKSCRHFLSCWPPVLGKSGMAEGPEESSESYVLGDLWKKRGRACVLGFPGISTRLSCPRQGGYSAEHLSVLNFCPSSQTRSLERNSHIESKQSSPISFESLKRSWSQLHCPSSRTRARAKVLRSACLRARASPCTYSSSVRVSRDLMTSTISPYKGTVRLLSARAGYTWARRRTWKAVFVRAVRCLLDARSALTSVVFMRYNVKGLGGITFARANEAASRLGLL